MADLTLTGEYELRIPDPVTGATTAAFAKVNGLRVVENGIADGDDTLTLTVEGVYPDIKPDAAITAQLSQNVVSGVAPLDFAGFTLDSVTEQRYPFAVSVITAKRVIDKDRFTADLLNRFDSEVTLATQFGLRNYPFLQRWDSILRPDGHVASAPTIWRWIADKAREGSSPSYQRLITTLAAFGLELVRSAPIPGYLSMTAADVQAVVVPLNYRRLFGETPASRQLPLTDILDSREARTEIAHLADDRLTREIQFSVPTERALIEQRAVSANQTRVVYTGGADKPSLNIGEQERPHYGVIALEGERLRRYLTNRNTQIDTGFKQRTSDWDAGATSLGNFVWQVRDGVSLPAEMGGGEWIVTSIDSDVDASSVGTTLTLRRYRNPTVAQVYANSPAPFNAADGWIEIHKLPAAPTLTMVNYDGATGEISLVPSVGAPIQSLYGAGAAIHAEKSATSPEADSSRVLITEYASSTSSADAILIERADVQGQANLIPFVDGLAEANIPAAGALPNSADANIYNIKVSYSNEWGEGAEADIAALMATRQLPTVAFQQIMPKRIQEQMSALPDQLYADYNAQIGGILVPTAATNELANPTGAASIVIAAYLQALNEQVALADLNIPTTSLVALYALTGIGVTGVTLTTGVVLSFNASYAQSVRLLSAILPPGFAPVGRLSFLISNLLHGAVVSSGGGVLQGLAWGRLLGILTAGARAANLVPVVGQVLSSLLSVAQLGIIGYSLLNRQNQDGAFINVKADGHGYPVRDALIQTRYRDGVLANWSEWANSPTASVGSIRAFGRVLTNPGGGYRLETESNGAGTIKSFLQFDPMSVIPQSGRQRQYRVAAITAVNDRIGVETDANWHRRLSGEIDVDGNPTPDGESQWLESVIIRENDYRAQWLRIAPNADNDDVAVTRIASGLPTYPES